MKNVFPFGNERCDRVVANVLSRLRTVPRHDA